MWNPSFDFRLFELGQFSPLQAQEFGAETVFSASDPPWYVDMSISRLFQGAEDVRERLRRTRDEADRLLREAGERERQSVNIGDVFRGRTVRSGEGTGPIVGSGETVSGDSSVGANSTAGAKVKEWLAAIPGGGGTFLIALLAIVFLFLFVRR